MKENCANWELIHVPTVVTKVGVEGNLVSLFQVVHNSGCEKRIVELNIIKKFLPHKNSVYFPTL